MESDEMREPGVRGTVYLVGAGPGDPGLLTVRGRELLRQADCVVYDRLVSGEVLGETKPGCEMIYVGKENHHHTMGQDQINDLLVRKAGEYRRTLRLKGGDPFVFGRGGEEALFLREHDIPVEVVPGVTSAVAAAAYAGIPVTHRGLSGGFHVVTAHDRHDGLADIDFDAMARGNDTCIFLMGLGKLGLIIQHLREAGMAEDMAVAVISHAATPQQKVCQGTLADIVVKVKKEELAPPALIVVGEVVSLRDQLGVCKKSCLIPKIGKAESALTQRLREQGFWTEELPVGEICYIGWQAEFLQEQRPDWLVFTSRHGVEGFFRGLEKADVDVRFFAGTKIAVIGDRTAESLGKHGLRPDLIPETADSMALCKALRRILQREDTVWYLKAEKTRSALEEELSGYCRLTGKTVYANREVKIRRPSGDYDAVVFTCASAVRRLYATGWDSGSARLYSIGPACTEQLTRLGKGNIIQADRADYESLVGKICETLI